MAIGGCSRSLGLILSPRSFFQSYLFAYMFWFGITHRFDGVADGASRHGRRLGLFAASPARSSHARVALDSGALRAARHRDVFVDEGRTCDGRALSLGRPALVAVAALIAGFAEESRLSQSVGLAAARGRLLCDLVRRCPICSINGRAKRTARSRRFHATTQHVVRLGFGGFSAHRHRRFGGLGDDN